MATIILTISGLGVAAVWASVSLALTLAIAVAAVRGNT